MGDLARDLAEAIDSVAALLARLLPAPRHCDSCHAEQETRIDAVIAGPDAFPGEHAGVRPFARCFRAIARSHNIDDPIDHRARFGRNAARSRHRADLDAFAATRAGIGHSRDACGERGFECLAHVVSPSLLVEYSADGVS